MDEVGFGRKYAARAVALCAGVVAALPPLAFAPSASAEAPILEGAYIRTITGSVTESDIGKTTTVTFTPCGPGCTTWRLASDGPDRTFNLYLQGDKWVRPSDTVMMMIDSVTLEGSAASTSGLPWFMKFTLSPAG